VDKHNICPKSKSKLLVKCDQIISQPDLGPRLS